MMKKCWINTFSYHSQMVEFKYKVKASEKMIIEELNKSKYPYVSYSGGKDSLVMLDMVLKQNPNIMVFHWDYGPYLMPRELEKEAIDIAISIGANNLIVETSDKYNNRNVTGIWHSVFFGDIVPRMLKNGIDLAFVGIRTEESLRRKRRIKAGKSLTAIKECWPLQDWTWMDVWSYIISNELPYISNYDLYGDIIGWDKIRFVTFFDPEFEIFGSPGVDGVIRWRDRY